MTQQEQFTLDRSGSKLNRYRMNEITEAMRTAAPLARKPALNAVSLGSGKTITITNGSAVLTQLSAIAPGDTVNFVDVVYKGKITLPGDCSYTGSLTTIVAQNEFGVHIKSGAQNFSINLKMRSNCGCIVADGPISDFTIDGDYRWGDNAAVGDSSAPNGVYYSRIAFRATNIARGTIKGKYHDSPNSDRTFDIYNETDCTYDVEQYDVNDGGHIDGSHLRTHIKRWKIAKCRRMGLEFQDQGGSGDDILIENFSIDGHTRPYNESFGISLMPQRCTNVRLVKPYCRAGTEQLTAGSHKGYGIEIGAGSGSSVTGAIVIGDYVAGFACSMKVPISGSRVYGSQQWGAFTGEPGLNGNGTFVDAGDNQSGLPLASAPGPGGTTTTDNTMAPKITAPISGTVLAPGGTFSLTIDGTNVSGLVDFIGDGLAAFPFTGNTYSRAIPATCTSIVVAASGDGGVANATYQVKAGTTTPPPPGNDYHVDLTGSFDIVGGKPTNVNLKPIVTAK